MIVLLTIVSFAAQVEIAPPLSSKKTPWPLAALSRSLHLRVVNCSALNTAAAAQPTVSIRAHQCQPIDQDHFVRDGVVVSTLNTRLPSPLFRFGVGSLPLASITAGRLPGLDRKRVAILQLAERQHNRRDSTGRQPGGEVDRIGCTDVLVCQSNRFP